MITILLLFSLTNIAFAQDNTEIEEINISKDIKSSDVLISATLIDENGKQISRTIPNTATICNKQQILEFMQLHIQWSSWVWIDHGNYFSVYTIPTIYYNDEIPMIITYEKSEFVNIVRYTDENMKIITDRGILDITNEYLKNEEYYMNIKEDSSISIWPK